MKKEILVQLPEHPTTALRLAKTALQRGLSSLICNPQILPQKLRARVTVYSERNGGDILITAHTHAAEKPTAVPIMIRKPADIERAVRIARNGASALILEAQDWKIIPLENLVAKLGKKPVKTFVRISSVDEAEAILHVLEVGATGVVVKPDSEDQLDHLAELVRSVEPVKLSTGQVTEVLEAGLGDRVCIDTTSMLTFGQGALVGSRANFLFLVHNESVGSQFTSPRPFRVNAGAVHSYLLLPGFKTKYLSEVQAGDRIVIVDTQGRSRVVSVGRAKIERRPLRIVKARCGEEEGSIALQNAETIRLVGENGQLITASEVKVGDKVLAHVTPPIGRHFGLKVDEFVVEK